MCTSERRKSVVCGARLNLYIYYMVPLQYVRGGVAQELTEKALNISLKKQKSIHMYMYTIMYITGPDVCNL